MRFRSHDGDVYVLFSVVRYGDKWWLSELGGTFATLLDIGLTDRGIVRVDPTDQTPTRPTRPTEHGFTTANPSRGCGPIWGLRRLDRLMASDAFCRSSTARRRATSGPDRRRLVVTTTSDWVVDRVLTCTYSRP